MGQRSQNPKVERYWQEYVQSLESGASAPESYEAWHFGDTETAARKLARLVRKGLKTATSALVWELEAKGFGLPNQGDTAVVTDLEGNPSCIIEITEVKVLPFKDIDDEQFAIDYGEGDTSLDSWKRDSWAYFSEVCEQIGREPSETMPIACQRFSVVYAGQE